MTRLVMAVVCTALIASTACKKENTATPFKPEGYWRGSAYLGEIVPFDFFKQN